MKTSAIVMVLGIVGIPGLVFAQAMGTPERAAIEQKVRTVFSDAPVMITVANCESRYRQFYDNGTTPFRGGTGNIHIGIFQINEHIHNNAALAQGFDIYTVDGNIGYARYMYDREGTRPWLGCLPPDSSTSTNTSSTALPIVPSDTSSSSATPSVTPSNSFPITRNLWPGMTHGEVKELQKILNANGFQIADSGPGSPGNETGFYGAKTRKAVEKFQCEKNVTCTGQTGYGYTGPKTRAALSALVGR